ncbi:hypothetical protein BKA61DRAFT_697609 [Leptodontidium sp. MPI-SDFR-AT-0119]|nr:hypothetical protein BKA61DRAFT_697609 [Leptodontidium sp. MPI-SDFR-AT-0119]
MLSLVQRQRGRHPQLTAPKLFKNLNSSTTGSSSPISQSHAKYNIQVRHIVLLALRQLPQQVLHLSTNSFKATNQQSFPIEKHHTISHYRKLPPTSMHSLTSISTSLRHRDNPNARFIKNELRSLHLASVPSSQRTAARLKAFTVEYNAFNGELLEIIVDLKAIGKDIQEEIATADSWSGILDVTEGLMDVGKDLDDLKKDVRAVRDDMMDLTELIDRHCCKGRVVIYG